MSKLFAICTDIHTGGFTKLDHENIVFVLPKNLNWKMINDLHSGTTTTYQWSQLAESTPYMDVTAQELVNYLFDYRFNLHPGSSACDCCGADFNIVFSETGFTSTSKTLVISHDLKSITTILQEYYKIDGQIYTKKYCNYFWLDSADYETTKDFHKEIDKRYQNVVTGNLAENEMEINFNKN
jgi:hypothetical protein